MTAGIPGAMTRGEADWHLYFYDPEHWRDGATAHRYVVYERGGEVAGYVLYRQKENWEQGHARNEVRIGDLQAVDGEAYRAVWGYCLSIDLVTTVKAHNRASAGPGHPAAGRPAPGAAGAQRPDLDAARSTWPRPWPPVATPSRAKWCSR